MPGALDGIRVLDLCIILAGPTCGRTLAEYGAEVIKIDVWHRPPNAKQPHDVGRGKKSICLDLTKAAGLEVFYQLVETADVVLTGFRKGVADRMGLGYEQLKARKPDIIYALINAFGQEGPWAGRPGYEQNAQAATGVQVRNAGRGQEPIPGRWSAAQPSHIGDMWSHESQHSNMNLIQVSRGERGRDHGDLVSVVDTEAPPTTWAAPRSL